MISTDRIPGYGLFRCAANADVEVKTFVLRLKIEQDRLSRWGEEAGLSQTNDSVAFSRYIKANEATIVEALKQIKTVLDILIRLTKDHETSPQKAKSVSSLSTERAVDISGLPETSSVVQKAYDKLTNVSHDNSSRTKYRRGFNHILQFAQDLFTYRGIRED